MRRPITCGNHWDAQLKTDRHTQGSSAESRKQIESRTPSTPLGTLELDASDVTEVGVFGAFKKYAMKNARKHVIELEGASLKSSCALQTLLMSDELKLDEIHCLMCLLTSHEEVSCVSPQSSERPLSP